MCPFVKCDTFRIIFFRMHNSIISRKLTLLIGNQNLLVSGKIPARNKASWKKWNGKKCLHSGPMKPRSLYPTLPNTRLEVGHGTTFQTHKSTLPRIPGQLRARHAGHFSMPFSDAQWGGRSSTIFYKTLFPVSGQSLYIRHM